MKTTGFLFQSCSAEPNNSSCKRFVSGSSLMARIAFANPRALASSQKWVGIAPCPPARTRSSGSPAADYTKSRSSSALERWYPTRGELQVAPPAFGTYHSLCSGTLRSPQIRHWNYLGIERIYRSYLGRAGERQKRLAVRRIS